MSSVMMRSSSTNDGAPDAPNRPSIPELGNDQMATPKSKEMSKPEPARKRARYENVEPECAGPGVNFAKFMDVPIDLLIEIAVDLHPIDLVALSRVNKYFRELFRSPGASLIWRCALLNVPELPPCPKSICETQYATLLFTRVCSTSKCGRRACYDVDPLCLVQLCRGCRNEQAIEISMIEDPSLVVVTRGLGRGMFLRLGWCLHGDAATVKSKLNELDAAGDLKAKERWMQERREEVEQRYKDAIPLSKWIQDRRHWKEVKQAQIKMARRTEIESRLKKLGWETDDFISRNDKRNKEWRSLVYNAKPLTGQAWWELLPFLLGYLEVNREERLQREVSDRLHDRETELKRRYEEIRDGLPPFARVISEDKSITFSWIEDRIRSLPPTFPAYSQITRLPRIKALLETDMPTESFIAKLDENDVLRDLIKDWKNTLDTRLVKLLPEDTPSPEFNTIPGSTLMYGPATEMKPLDNLPMNLQKLLRGDVIFRTTKWIHFYPDNFNDVDFHVGGVVYCVGASKIAKAFLSELGRPNASYLELKSLGNSFQCMRCNTRPAYRSWEEMVLHYLQEELTWKRTSESQSVRQAKDFTFVFTHDVNLVKPNRPLVRIVDYANKALEGLDVLGVGCICKLCASVGLHCFQPENYVVNHVRDVHLVEDPEKGEHYY